MKKDNHIYTTATGNTEELEVRYTYVDNGVPYLWIVFPIAIALAIILLAIQ